MPADISECPSILPEREKRNPSTPEKESLNTLPPWSLADEMDEAGGSTRASGDSTLKSTIRDAFPLRELRASQQTGDIAPLSTPSASDISRHDRSCLSFGISKNKTKSSVGLNLTLANTHACAGRHTRECFPYHSRTEARRHTLPAYNKRYMQRANTTDPGPTTRRTPRLCPPTHAIVFFLFYPYSRLTIDHEPNHSTINRTCADISESVEKRKCGRGRGKESRNMRARENHRT
ncbi:LOW QUALITY PROTEIN: hypothetical protein V1477_001652 [Vespula maculifrons]|uniref:Uncharacterized protein n=1 Tax=Vespula maculifrons TaxID=7453 RepID=A0ABD2CYG7_VESMC